MKEIIYVRSSLSNEIVSKLENTLTKHQQEHRHYHPKDRQIKKNTKEGKTSKHHIFVFKSSRVLSFEVSSNRLAMVSC